VGLFGLVPNSPKGNPYDFAEAFLLLLLFRWYRVIDWSYGSALSLKAIP
jgi:hypothetical protein